MTESTNTSAVDSPFANHTKHPRVWHYTNSAGLLGILDSRCLWASSPKALNDLEEISFGLASLRTNLERFSIQSSLDASAYERFKRVLADEIIGKQIDSLFVLSSSYHPDSLNQWHHYSDIDGYAIELDTSVPLGVKLDNGSTFLGRNKDTYVFPNWYDVVYNYDEHASTSHNIFRFLLELIKDPRFSDDNLLFLVSRFVVMSHISRFKHVGFKDEREVRFISSRSAEGQIKYRTSNGRLVPYIELFVHKEGSDSSRSDFDFIKGIVCGPTTHQNDVLLLENLLASRGLAHIKVSRSDIPFRN